MNTLIVWATGELVNVYAVPTKYLEMYGGKPAFVECHGHMINGGDQNETGDIFTQIEYLAWLLGEEPVGLSIYGTIPTLDELRAQHKANQNADPKKREGINLNDLPPKADPPFKGYKLPGTDIPADCHRVISTGWFM